MPGRVPRAARRCDTTGSPDTPPRGPRVWLQISAVVSSGCLAITCGLKGVSAGGTHAPRCLKNLPRPLHKPLPLEVLHDPLARGEAHLFAPGCVLQQFNNG